MKKGTSGKVGSVRKAKAPKAVARPGGGEKVPRLRSGGADGMARPGGNQRLGR